MPIPGLPAPLPSVTGGPAVSTAGDIAAKTGSIGGISSPVVIGGFKSDGTAMGGAIPAWILWAAGIAAVIAASVFIWKQMK